MKLGRFRHKGLKDLYDYGDSRSITPAMADKLRKILLAIETGENVQQLGRFPGLEIASA